MPNWCSNEVTITGSEEVINRLWDKIGDKFDFNGIIPMPEELNSERVGMTGDNVKVVCDDNKLCHLATGPCVGMSAINVARDSEKVSSLTRAVLKGYPPCKCLKAAIESLSFPLEESIAMVTKYGYDNWYDWSRSRWGVKWNAHNVDCTKTRDTINAFFDTAWAPPEPIYNALVEQFPDLDIEWHYNEPGCCFSGDFDTGTENDFADPCLCEDEECMECHPENFDDNGNYIEKG